MATFRPALQEVSRGHSTPISIGGRTKPIKLEKLHPQYVVGFIDGEGCFYVSRSKHRTTRRRLDVRADFEMELRIDDEEILQRIHQTIGCGKIYYLKYQRYDWLPHVKLKIGSIKEICETLIPFIDKYPLQAKKAKVFRLFREAAMLIKDKQHLTDKGYRRIIKLREGIRAFSKKHYRNR